MPRHLGRSRITGKMVCEPATKTPNAKRIAAVIKAYWDDEYQGEGIYLGQGSMHDLRDADTEPKLWRAKSVSRAAAIALHKSPETPQRAIGFHRPKR